MLETYTKVATGDYVVQIQDALEKQKSNDVFSTGFSDIDEAFTDSLGSGFRGGDLVVISGKSGNGKTLLAQNLVKNFIDNGVPTLFFSYEVRINNVYQTFMDMGMDEAPEIYTPKKNVTGDIKWVFEKIKEADEKFFTKMIVIDHLDFLTAKDIKTSDHRRNEINNIVTALKNFAIEHDKIIILLAHVVKTKEKTLQNEDIADSRAINNLSDAILFISRELDEDGMAASNRSIIKISKNRLTGTQKRILVEVNNKIITKCDEPQIQTSTFGPKISR